MRRDWRPGATEGDGPEEGCCIGVSPSDAEESAVGKLFARAARTDEESEDVPASPSSSPFRDDDIESVVGNEGRRFFPTIGTERPGNRHRGRFCPGATAGGKKLPLCFSGDASVDMEEPPPLAVASA